MASRRRRATGLRIPRADDESSHPQVLFTTPPLIQKRFSCDISHVETETPNLILDHPSIMLTESSGALAALSTTSTLATAAAHSLCPVTGSPV